MTNAIACSFATAVGVEYEYRGKVYRWDFSPMFGPLWLDADGEPAAEQYRHHACACWKAFAQWQTEQARDERRKRLRNEYRAELDVQRVIAKILPSGDGNG